MREMGQTTKYPVALTEREPKKGDYLAERSPVGKNETIVHVKSVAAGVVVGESLTLWGKKPFRASLRLIRKMRWCIVDGAKEPS